MQAWFPVYLSIKVALLAIVIVTMVGLPLARFMARKEFHGKNVLEALITMPLVLPPSVIGFALLVLIGKNGPLGKLLGELGISIVFTWKAAVLASAVVAFPLMYQSAKAAFQSVDLSLENAARTLQASELKVFLTVTLPLSWSGIIAGLVLSFARALGEFGATLMVAGNIPGQTQTIPVAIYFAMYAGDNQTAWRLVGLITVFSFLVTYWVNSWSRRHIH